MHNCTWSFAHPLFANTGSAPDDSVSVVGYTVFTVQHNHTKGLVLLCPTLTKGSNSQITQIWESDVFRLDLAYSTSIRSRQKHSSCWKILKSRYNDMHWCQCTWQTHFACLQEMSFSRVASFCQWRQYCSVYKKKLCHMYVIAIPESFEQSQLCLLNLLLFHSEWKLVHLCYR